MNYGHSDDSAPRIRLSAISRQVGRHFGLNDISLSVAPGEILGLIGHTGAGKSSLLRIIAGLDMPDSGEVKLSGRVATREKPHLRGVAMVFQRDVHYPGRSLELDRREAERAGALKRWAEAGLAPEEIYRELEFDERLFAQPPETLSGGQGRRASLLRAMFRDMPILLADEPLAGLDLWTRDRVARLLWRFVKATGKSLVAVSHEPVEAIGLADRLAVLDRGRLVQIGSANELRTDPRHRVVVSLLQYPPWNEVSAVTGSDAEPGEIRLVDPQYCTVTQEVEGGSPEIAVKLLRSRWSSVGPFLEWIETRSGAVFRTPDTDEPPDRGALTWKSGTELRFGSDGKRI